jgi:hypothetical protein
MADFRSKLELMYKWIFFVENKPGNSGRYIKESLQHDAHAVEHARKPCSLLGAGRQNKKK